MRFEVRVVHTGPAVYGRNRVGSEITTILEADRHLLLRLAERYQRDDSRRAARPRPGRAAQRRPQPAVAQPPHAQPRNDSL